MIRAVELWTQLATLVGDSHARRETATFPPRREQQPQPSISADSDLAWLALMGPTEKALCGGQDLERMSLMKISTAIERVRALPRRWM